MPMRSHKLVKARIRHKSVISGRFDEILQQFKKKAIKKGKNSLQNMQCDIVCHTNNRYHPDRNCQSAILDGVGLPLHFSFEFELLREEIDPGTRPIGVLNITSFEG